MKEHRKEPIMKLVTPTKQTQLRQKALVNGVKSLSDAELLAMYINPANIDKCSIGIANDLLEHYGDLRAVLNADFREIDDTFHIQTQAGKELSRRSDFINLQKDGPIESLDEAYTFIKRQLRDYKNEVFAVLFLDNHNNVIAYEELFCGTINATAVHVRPIIERVLHYNAGRVIISHNHPAGNATPSDEDYGLTKKIKVALELIDTYLIDHVVVGDNEIYSIVSEKKSICN